MLFLPTAGAVALPLPLLLPLPLPGLDIRIRIRIIFFRSQFGGFHFSVFRLDNVVLVNFGRKKTCFGRVWPRKLVLVNLGRKNRFWSILAGKNGLRRFWPGKLGFDWKN